MKKTVIFLIIALSLWGCNNFEECNELDTFPEYKESTKIAHENIPGTDVSMVEVCNIVNNQLVDCANRSKGADDLLDVTVVKPQDGDGSVVVVNRGDNQGFVLISGRKDYHPILAYSSEGRFDVNEIAEPTKCWLDGTLNAISNRTLQSDSSKSDNNLAWTQYAPTIDLSASNRMSRSIPYEEYMQLQHIFQDSIESWQRQGYTVYSMREYVDMDPVNNAWAEVDENTVYPQYWEDAERISFVVIKTRATATENPSPIKAMWHQRYPYNKFFPSVGSLTNAYVGCSAIAAGLIMYHYKYPKSINWSNIFESTYTDDLGKLLYNLASKSSPEYSEDGTGIGINNIFKTLKSYGYAGENAEYNKTRVNQSLAANCPVLASSEYLVNGEKRNHAWVLSSRLLTATYYTTEVWTFLSRNSFQRWTWQERMSEATGYYVNWGWWGNGNGYYHDIGYICPPNATNMVYNKILYNLKPTSK